LFKNRQATLLKRNWQQSNFTTSELERIDLLFPVRKNIFLVREEMNEWAVGA